MKATWLKNIYIAKNVQVSFLLKAQYTMLVPLQGLAHSVEVQMDVNFAKNDGEILVDDIPYDDRCEFEGRA